jgi:Protein of unknown function (DUF3109)
MSRACNDCAALRLSPCDVRQCEARCCYDGAYIEPAEEAFLVELVDQLPDLKAHLPDHFIIDGYWDGEKMGRKTATRSHDYRSADFPAHFAHTRCVFADAEGFCELEKLARSRGQHPWTFKPATCWLFPLHEEAGAPMAPVSGPADDPYRSDDYPGYSPFVPCGRHDDKGRPWREALSSELSYLRNAAVIPLLGSAGHEVEDLLHANQQGKKNPA